MSPTVLKSLLARRDLVEVASYLEQAAGLATADRFLTAVERALARLASSPLTGSPWQSSNPRLLDVRSQTVPGFRKYLIFYRPLDTGIEVLRVLHGARDTESLVEEEPSPP
jgi:toxin ParE1/3/4